MLTQQQRIDLAIAKKQAAESFKSFPDFEIIKDEYKKRVNLFYEWNTQLDSELLEAGKKPISNTPEQRSSQPSSSNLPTEISPKQKHCPRCREPIPKTWTNHGKCGWNVVKK